MDNYNSNNHPQMYPQNPGYSNYPPQPTQPVQPMSPQPIQPTHQHGNTTTLIIIIVLALLAIGGMIFGTATFISSSQEVIALNEKIAEQDSIIKNNIALSSTSDTNTKDYIYIGEWGVKIQIPADLSWVGYSFIPSNNTSSVAVYGAKGQFDTRPAFLDAITPMGGLGFITRSPAGYGSVDGVKVFSSGGYDYFYALSQVIYSTEPGDIELETASQDLVQTMLTTAANYTSI